MTKEKKNEKGFKTSFGERMSYGSFFTGQNIIFAFILQFLGLFYASEVGLSPAAIGTLFLIARVWDAINDPILGGIVDRSNPKKGKFKPWIKAVGLLMPIATFFVFMKISDNTTTSLIYAYITYIAWGMIYTVSDVPIFALATTMTDNLNERVTLMSIGRLFAVFGFLAMIVGGPMIENMGYAVTVGILMVIALLTMIPIRFMVKERVVYKRDNAVTLKSMFNAVAKNKYLIAFYSAFILMVGFGTYQTVSAFFAQYNLGNLELSAAIMGTMIVPMLVIPIFAPSLIRKFGKRKIFITLVAFGLIMSILQYFAGYENFTLFLVLNALKGIGTYSPLMLMGMFSADCAEYGAYVTGKRNEGVTFSIQTFSTKLGQAFSGAIGMYILGWYGFASEAAEQSQRTLNGIWNTMTLIPIIGVVLGLLVFILFYKLKEEDVEKMIKEMQAKEAVSIEK